MFSLVFCLRLDIVKFVLFIFFSFLNCIYFLVFFSFLYFLSFFFHFFFFSFLELYFLANFILYFLQLKIIFFLKFFVNLTCCLSYFTKSQNFSFLEKRNDILFPISVFFLKIEHLFTKKTSLNLQLLNINCSCSQASIQRSGFSWLVHNRRIADRKRHSTAQTSVHNQRVTGSPQT